MDISILFWNIWLENQIGSRDRLDELRRELDYIIRSHNPAVIGLNEVMLKTGTSLPEIEDADKIPSEFAKYWNQEKQNAFEDFCKSENINPDKLNHVISRFMFTEREPLNEEIVDMLEDKPKLLERHTITERVKGKVMELIDVFMTGAPDEEENIDG